MPAKPPTDAEVVPTLGDLIDDAAYGAEHKDPKHWAMTDVHPESWSVAGAFVGHLVYNALANIVERWRELHPGQEITGSGGPEGT